VLWAGASKELQNHPLRLLPWDIGEFVSDYKTILTTGDIDTQEKIYNAVKTLFQAQGYTEAIDDWKGKYFVG
jgi:hypothetical protein